MCMIQKIPAVATMACKAAVKGHDVLSTREAEELIHRLLGLEHPLPAPMADRRLSS